MSEKVHIVELDLDNKISPHGVEYHAMGRIPLTMQAYPSVQVISGAPTTMEPGKGLPKLGQLSVTFDDFKTGENDKGTYFGKLLGANEFFENRKIYVYHGEYSDNLDLNTLKKRLYIIKSIDGPNSRGSVTIRAVDPLTKFFESDRVIPAPTNGELAIDITGAFLGQINITNNDGFEPLGGVADFNGEWIRYSSTVGDSDIVISERNVFGTENDEHKAGESVSNAFTFENVLVVDLIKTLFDYVGIDPSFIDLDQWNEERDDYLSSEFMTGGWSSPEKVRDKVSDICKQAHVSVWWNDEEHRIPLLAVGPNLTPVKLLEEGKHILDKGQDVKRDPSKSLTRVWVWFQKLDHSGDDEANNYHQALLLINPDLEADTAYGEVREAIIHASYLPNGGAASAQKLAERTLEQNSRGTFKYIFQLYEKDADIKVGETIDVLTSKIQGADGVPLLTNFLVIERDLLKDQRYKYTAIVTGVDPGSRYAAWAPDDLLDYENETIQNQYTYLFYSADDDTLPNGDDAYVWL